jgi:hypothetical protein
LFFGNFQKTQEDWEKKTKEIKGDDKKTNIVIVFLIISRGQRTTGRRIKRRNKQCKRMKMNMTRKQSFFGNFHACIFLQISLYKTDFLLMTWV